MKWATKRRARTLLVSVAIVAAIATLVARLSRMSKDGRPKVVTRSESRTPVASPTEHLPVQAQTNSTDVQPTPPAIASPAANTSPTVPGLTSPSPARLIIPVAGVRPEQLRDTFSEARSEGRVHDAIDIPAARGTPVVAAADGPIVKLFQSERGGITIYQLSTDGRFVYYYAHLDRYAEGLAEGHFAKQGETIAYVGDSGNAGPGNYHLHFSIAEISNPKDFWHGVNINPYPLLRK
ncbi:MAG TPA: peptidoglycan DD-metalloendopeptidase family protein [Pyrinomonadaceae bacterium]|nr:peptidoglycan DD-metalloendopeptidase family protein [Pyrinomonadaceae bacterium]